jgi:hypothetical protein
MDTSILQALVRLDNDSICHVVILSIICGFILYIVLTCLCSGKTLSKKRNIHPFNRNATSGNPQCQGRVPSGKKIPYKQLLQSDISDEEFISVIFPPCARGEPRTGIFRRTRSASPSPKTHPEMKYTYPHRDEPEFEQEFNFLYEYLMTRPGKHLTQDQMIMSYIAHAYYNKIISPKRLSYRYLYQKTCMTVHDQTYIIKLVEGALGEMHLPVTYRNKYLRRSEQIKIYAAMMDRVVELVLKRSPHLKKILKEWRET